MSASKTQQNMSGEKLRVVLYSSDRTVREQVRTVLGRRIAPDLPELECFEFATQPALFKSLDKDAYDVAILDGEAVPGGMGISRQMREELADPAPVVLLVARQADSWMAAWSKAEAVAPYPLDPLTLPQVVAQVVRDHRSGRRTPLSSDRIKPGVSSRHVEQS